MLLIKLAARNLSRRRARSILTIIGVAIAIAFTVTILSISEGLMASFENSIAKQGADIVIVPKEAEAYPYPDVAAFVGSFPEELLDEIEQLENVLFPMEIARVPEKERLERAKELLGNLGLSKRMHHKPKELSAGESQRVAIARSLANEPLLLLADEPTGNLDSTTTKEITALLQQLNKEYQIAIILVTHDSQVTRAASRTLQMVDGRLDSNRSQ